MLKATWNNRMLNLGSEISNHLSHNILVDIIFLRETEKSASSFGPREMRHSSIRMTRINLFPGISLLVMFYDDQVENSDWQP